MGSRPERVAVIDDTDVVREVLVRQLSVLGFAALEAADGNTGLELIRREHPNIVLCDLRMPNLDGLDLLRIVREEYPMLPVIVMSGAGLLQDAVGALKLGAWDYISKPVDTTALAHAVTNALEKAALIDENRRQRARLEVLNRELEVSLRLLAEDEDAGRQIQTRMLPRNHLQFGPYTISRDVVPSTFLSGDFIDAFAIDERHMGFYLADVSGHGVSSALVTVLLRTFVQRQVANYTESKDALILSPARLLERLNDEMARDALDKHLTIFYGIIDLSDDTLLYANAGHFPWPILCVDDSVRILEEPAVPVGMMSGTRYSEHRIRLSTDATLTVFSDGMLAVLPQPTLDEKLAYLQRYFGRLDVSIDEVRREFNLSGGIPLPDDVAILVIQRGGNHGNNAGA